MQTVFKYVKALISPINNHTTITWRLNSGYIPVGSHLDFYVEVAYAGGPWTRLNSAAPVVNQAIYDDPNAYTWTVANTTMYRVVMDDDGDEYNSPAVGIYGELTHQERRLAAEITRRKYVQFAKRTGSPGYLLRKKESGVTCPCTDPDLGTVSTGFCSVCYGTGFVGGFYDPYPFYMEFLDTSGITRKEDGQTGVDLSLTKKARVVNYPEFLPDDIWVDTNTNERYIIGTVTKPEIWLRRLHIIMQIQLDLLPATSSEYSVPIVAPTGEGWASNIAFLG